MQITPLSIESAWKVTPRQHGDDRGVFLERFTAGSFAEAVGHRLDVQQANLSTSAGRRGAGGRVRVRGPGARVRRAAGRLRVRVPVLDALRTRARARRGPVDAELAIDWPTTARDGTPLTPRLSPKDAVAPSLSQAAEQGLLPSYAEALALRRSLAQ